VKAEYEIAMSCGWACWLGLGRVSVSGEYFFCVWVDGVLFVFWVLFLFLRSFVVLFGFGLGCFLCCCCALFMLLKVTVAVV